MSVRAVAAPVTLTIDGYLLHCLGLLEWWGGAMVAGRPVVRDRDAPLRGEPMFPEDAETPFGRTQAGVLVHVLSEIAQHLGQMELSRDVLRASS